MYKFFCLPINYLIYDYIMKLQKNAKQSVIEKSTVHDIASNTHTDTPTHTHTHIHILYKWCNQNDQLIIKIYNFLGSVADTKTGVEKQNPDFIFSNKIFKVRVLYICTYMYYIPVIRCLYIICHNSLSNRCI